MNIRCKMFVKHKNTIYQLILNDELRWILININQSSIIQLLIIIYIFLTYCLFMLKITIYCNHCDIKLIKVMINLLIS